MNDTNATQAQIQAAIRAEKKADRKRESKRALVTVFVVIPLCVVGFFGAMYALSEILRAAGH